MPVNLLIAQGSAETGQLLSRYLQEQGLALATTVSIKNKTICYGVSGPGVDVLNTNCRTDKITRLVTMSRAGVGVIPWFPAEDYQHYKWSFPLLARKAYGHGGQDIVPVFQAEEIPWRIAAGWSWFSTYIPVKTEYRVWIFRNEHLGTYEKTMRRPTDYKRVGRNHGNGFDFEYLGDAIQVTEATRQATMAVASLGLDFAAVDLLHGKDDEIYVLEVNTAPGVIASGAQKTLHRLADRIVAWANK